MLLLLRKRDDEGDEIGVLVAVGGRDMSRCTAVIGAVQRGEGGMA